MSSGAIAGEIKKEVDTINTALAVRLQEAAPGLSHRLSLSLSQVNSVMRVRPNEGMRDE